MPAYEFRSPTATTAPVAGVTAGLWTFAQPAKKFILSNDTTQTIFVRVNGSGAASSATHDFRLMAGYSQIFDGEAYGYRTISTVSVWLDVGADASKITVRGV